MKNIAVIGSGTMGNGIAHVFAQYGFKVSLVDISQGVLDKAMLTITKNLERQLAKEKISQKIKDDTIKAIELHTSLELGVKNADLVIEAATENQELKLNIFKELDELSPQACILASNTSSISITKIAAATNRPEKVVGMHFMNPVPMMQLVEVIRGYATSDQTTEAVMALSQELSKTPVEVNDYPGFVANRILIPMINEAIITLHEGVAGVTEIDQVMQLGMSHPMGPLQLADFIGLDVCYSILNIMHKGMGNPKYAPCPLLTNMVEAGFVGKKSGEGFYTYEKGTKNTSISKRFS